MRKLTDQEKEAFRKCIDIQVKLFNQDKQGDLLGILFYIEKELDNLGKDTDKIKSYITVIQNEIIGQIPATEYTQHWFKHLYNNWLDTVEVED